MRLRDRFCFLPRYKWEWANKTEAVLSIFGSLSHFLFFPPRDSPFLVVTLFVQSLLHMSFSTSYNKRKKKLPPGHVTSSRICLPGGEVSPWITFFSHSFFYFFGTSFTFCQRFRCVCCSCLSLKLSVRLPLQLFILIYWTKVFFIQFRLRNTLLLTLSNCFPLFDKK